jgi:type I restriction enzyme S subunit
MNSNLNKKLFIDKSNWIKVKLGDVVAEPRDTVKDFAAEQIEHVVGLEHIDSEDIHLRRSANMDSSTTFTKKFSAGDVLFGRRRAYLKKAAQAKFSGICSGDITVMRAKEGLLPELLPFVINNEKFFDYAVTHSAGGLSPRVKFKDLANYEFLLPPKDQQVQLAELLWAMDELIEMHSKFRNRVLMTKKAFFRESVKNVNLISLSELAEVSYGLGQPPEKDENGVAVIRATNIKRGKILDEDILRIKASAIPKGKKIHLLEGDLIVVRSGAYTGDVAMITQEWEGAVGGYDLIVRPFREKVDPRFLTEYLEVYSFLVYDVEKEAM